MAKQGQKAGLERGVRDKGGLTLAQGIDITRIEAAAKACVLALGLLAGLAVESGPAAAEDTPAAGAPPTAADELADIFSKLGDQLYEDCIFELSEEQIEVQEALVEAYVKAGASGTTARRLAASQIKPPKISKTCEQFRNTPQAQTSGWGAELDVPKLPPVAALPAPGPAAAPEKPSAAPAKPAPDAKPPPPKPQQTLTPAPRPSAGTAPAEKPAPQPSIALKDKTGVPQWDCAPGVDFVTVHINGYPRKLTGGEICNPYQDVVHEVPNSLASFRLGYVIKTGRLFIVADGVAENGKTIAWGISGRDVCRNNPDPDCLAARAVGSLPPGEYAFAGKAHRINWGPKTKRNVAAVYLKKLWNKDRFTKQQITGMLARGNIAIHVRLKGEMSEACIGLEPKGWAYVANLIKSGRTTGLNVYIDEPHPQIAEAPPLVAGSEFSLLSLFK